jgi:hypothetical protein
MKQAVASFKNTRVTAVKVTISFILCHEHFKKVIFQLIIIAIPVHKVMQCRVTDTIM